MRLQWRTAREPVSVEVTSPLSYDAPKTAGIRKDLGTFMGTFILVVLYSFVAFFSVSSPVFAAGRTSKALPRSEYSGFSITPTISAFHYSGGPGTEDSLLYGVKFGYDNLETSVVNSLGVEGTVNYFTTDGLDGYMFRVDALYPFILKGKFVPFLAVGLGGLNTTSSTKSQLKPLLNYGGGLKYFLRDDLALRVDGRHLLIYNDVNTSNNFEAGIGLSYYFGKEAKKLPPPPKPKTKQADKKPKPGVVLPIPVPGIMPEGGEPGDRTKIIALEGNVVVEKASATPATPTTEGMPATGAEDNGQVVLTPGAMIIVEKNRPLPASVPASPEELARAAEASIVEEASPGIGAPALKEQAAADEEVVGKIVALRGKVTIERAGSVVAASMNAPIQAGDKVKTAGASQVKVQFRDNSTISLSEKSKVVVKDFVQLGRKESSAGETRVGGAASGGMPGTAADMSRKESASLPPEKKERQEGTVGGAASGTKGGAASARGTGLPAPAPGNVVGRVTVRFEIAQWNIEAEYTPQLQKIADILRLYPGSVALIEGHTDTTGTKKLNMKLSSRRAESVKKALVALGASPRGITARGYGYSLPEASNATEEGRKLNRRAVTTVTIEVAPVGVSSPPVE